MNTHIKVSVILPSLNVAKYIEECVRSAINQTLQDIEIICVDAGSTDGTLEILRQLAQQDSRIKLLHSPVKSYGAQMNMGFRRAQGEFLAILETDDYILPEMYQELYAIAQENNLDFVKSDFERFRGEEDNRVFAYASVYHTDWYDKVINPLENIDVFEAVMNTWTGLYRMEFLKKYNIIHNETPGASYQDNGFWFQTFIYAERMMFVNKAYYKLRRDNANSSVHSKGKIYTIYDEYDFIEKIVRSNREMEKKFIAIFHKKKYDNCIYHYDRISQEFRKEYLDRMHSEFKAASQMGELDKEVFGETKWKILQTIVSSPDRYYRLTNNKYSKKLYASLVKVHTLWNYVRKYGIVATVNKVSDKARKKKL